MDLREQVIDTLLRWPCPPNSIPMINDVIQYLESARTKEDKEAVIEVLEHLDQRGVLSLRPGGFGDNSTLCNIYPVKLERLR